MFDAERALVGLAQDDQRRLASDLAQIVAAYGRVEPSVVDPGWFTELSNRTQESAATGDDVRSLVAECEEFIEGFDEEPDGAGFYAVGALVSLYYLSTILTGTPSCSVRTSAPSRSRAQN